MRRTMNTVTGLRAFRLMVGVPALAVAMSVSGNQPANADLVKIHRDGYCKGEIAYCGTITFENGGGYVVSDTRLEGRAADAMPRILSADSETCADLNIHHKGDITLGNAVSFIVPATCTYTLKLKLVLAPDLSSDLVLTPGCKATLKSYGTVFEPKLKKEKAEGTVQDMKGNDCGS